MSRSRLPYLLRERLAAQFADNSQAARRQDAESSRSASREQLLDDYPQRPSGPTALPLAEPSDSPLAAALQSPLLSGQPDDPNRPIGQPSRDVFLALAWRSTCAV